LNCRISKNEDGGQGAAPVGEGSAFFVLSRSEAADARCPFVHQVSMGGSNRPDLPPVPDGLILDNGSAAKSGQADPPRAHANFTRIYGAFPTSMGMDVAAALLLLRMKSAPGLPLPLLDGQQALPDNPRVACFKKGETGDWGMIVLGSDSP
jgi:hypothetical protein